MDEADLPPDGEFIHYTHLKILKTSCSRCYAIINLYDSEDSVIERNCRCRSVWKINLFHNNCFIIIQIQIKY
ncbi:hypothetical protein KSF78_0008000 [Schistosoma japonicum]|nr:hypothetical protein KSF78_0008000 [Schistosoma japonicum]